MLPAVQSSWKLYFPLYTLTVLSRCHLVGLSVVATKRTTITLVATGA